MTKSSLAGAREGGRLQGGAVTPRIVSNCVYMRWGVAA